MSRSGTRSGALHYAAAGLLLLALAACDQAESPAGSDDQPSAGPAADAVSEAAQPDFLPDGMIRQPSVVAPGQAMRALNLALRNAGLTVFVRVDHAANARRAELQMPAAQLMIFGNPTVGTPVMTDAPTAALDLPMKLLAYTDAAGKHWVAYNDPAWIAKRHNLPGDHPSIQTMTAAMQRFAAVAAGGSAPASTADKQSGDPQGAGS